MKWILSVALSICFLMVACGGSEDEVASGEGESCTTTTDCKLGLKWVPIPEGTFEMGCSPNNTCPNNEMPAHSVTVSSFEMLETEVTQEQYFEVTGSNPSHHSDCPTCPVESVNWNEAKAFCEAVGGRFPTEAEWEYAARGGTTTKYYCGDDDSDCLNDIAWYFANSDDETHPVGTRDPNDHGLYDMLGNVWEWTADWYGSDYYEISPAKNPQGPNSGSERVKRGGCFRNDGPLRVSARDYADPLYVISTNGLGFRCVKDAP